MPCSIGYGWDRSMYICGICLFMHATCSCNFHSTAVNSNATCNMHCNCCDKAGKALNINCIPMCHNFCVSLDPQHWTCHICTHTCIQTHRHIIMCIYLSPEWNVPIFHILRPHSIKKRSLQRQNNSQHTRSIINSMLLLLVPSC